MNRFDSDPLQYMEIYNRLTPIATDTVNDSIDFLPILNTSYSELCNCFIPKTNWHYQRELPTYQCCYFPGLPLQAPTYCFGSPTEIAIPTPTTGAFPSTLTILEIPSLSTIFLVKPTIAPQFNASFDPDCQTNPS
ncbi:hypothetical protein MHU86_18733 [Fragilaria crotonensis]|nr:hypothetical protein MHU86_18733 [Fragilaria crotonensis]